MPMEKPTVWTGASGIDYLYSVFALDAEIPSRPGNYIYSKKNEENSWVPVFMAVGDLAVRCTDPDRLKCIAAKGATHVHLRLIRRAEDRTEELLDLMRRYTNAYEPDGCHTEAERPAPLEPAQDVAAPSPDEAAKAP